ncbi:MAG: YkgJ family cysteine cluster protein, partial [Planctomycetota bacterium]
MTDWIDRCREIFERADRAASELSTRVGLGCPPGCGACCNSPDVETTVAEMRPLARRIVEEGRTEEVVARIDRATEAGERRCVSYVADPFDPRIGRCGVYADRPLVCRLFGFAASRDKHGRDVFRSCGVL